MAAQSMEDIAEQLKKTRFQKKFFGGVDEEDVWRKLDELQKEYQSAFDAQQERNNALLEERSIVIRQLRARLRKETG